MNVLPSPELQRVIEHLNAGKSLRSIQRATGIHRDTIMRIKKGKRFAEDRSDGKCRYIAQAIRINMYGRSIPEGMRLGWTCKVPYCDNPDHFVLSENLNYGQASYKEYRAKLCALAEGEYFDIPDWPNDERSAVKFRTGLGAMGPHFIMRSLPAGGIRIIRAGSWGDSKGDWMRRFPVLTARKAVRDWSLTPGAAFLGLLWGSWDDLPEERRSKCSVRGCPFPQITDRMCRQHLQFFDIPYSSHGTLEGWQVSTRATDRNPTPDPLFTVGWLGEERTMFLNTMRVPGATFASMGKTGVRHAQRFRTINGGRKT